MAISSTSSVTAFTGGLWQAISRAWAYLESTERGYVWLSKLGPAYVFGMIAVFKALGTFDTLERVQAGGGSWLLACYQASGLMFFGLVAALYVFRRRPIRRVAGPLEGLAALLGSYIMMPVAVAGRVSDDVGVLTAANILMVVGTFGAAAALASLGRCFGIFPEARGLVTHGLYRAIRHPMYLFEFIAFLGVLLPAFTVLNAMLYLIFVAMQLARMVFEEQALTQAFPEIYPGYARRTARLIPGLY